MSVKSTLTKQPSGSALCIAIGMAHKDAFCASGNSPTRLVPPASVAHPQRPHSEKDLLQEFPVKVGVVEVRPNRQPNRREDGCDRDHQHERTGAAFRGGRYESR
jgi:hypothetical protein